MTISKEVRIGLLVAIAGVIFFAGFSFLKGSDVFSSESEFYCYYPTVDGLQKSSVVQVKGINIGQVADMELAGEKGVKVILSIHNSVSIPEGTVANLASSDLLGTKVIRLDMGKGPGTIPAKSVLESKKDGSMVDKLSGELTPRLEELKGTIIAFNQALNNVNALVGDENQKAITGAIQSLKATSDNLAHLSAAIDKESGQISSILRNANSVTANLAKSNDTVQRILSNTSRITGQLANAPIQKTLADLQKTTAQLQSIMDKINNNQGSLGMFINNKDAYNNLNNSLKSITNLTDDLKARPSRYINVSVFGGKKKD